MPEWLFEVEIFGFAYTLCERILTLPMDLLQFVVAIIKIDFKESDCRLADVCVAGKYKCSNTLTLFWAFHSTAPLSIKHICLLFTVLTI